MKVHFRGAMHPRFWVTRSRRIDWCEVGFHVIPWACALAACVLVYALGQPAP